MPQSLPEQLRSILGSGAVLTGPELGDFAIDGLPPQAVARPDSREQVSELLKWATTEKVAVFPRGGGTRTALGNTPGRVDVVLDLTRLDRVLDYQPADMTVSVEAGITLGSLQAQLEVSGQFVPLEAPAADRSTVGGILSVGGSGPLAHTYGPPRDWLIGIAVVDAGGLETKAGGKVVKNVTGYDLNKLYTGSLGTLGVIVETTFKLTPEPAEKGVLIASFQDMGKLVQAGRALLGGPFAPIGYQAYTGGLASRFMKSHEAISPIPAPPDSAVSFSFYAGRARATNRRLGEAGKLLQASGAASVQRVEGAVAESVHRWATDQASPQDWRPPLVIKVSVPASQVSEVAASAQALISPGGPAEVAADPGFGTLRLYWETGDRQPGDDWAVRVIASVQALARHYGGSAVVERCSTDIKAKIDVFGDAPEGMDIMRRIKEKFDPDGILNPGRFLGRL